MRRATLAIAVAAAGLFGCPGHLQADGVYALTADQVVRDECGLASDPNVFKELSLQVAGDVVRADYSLYGIQLAGGFLEGPLFAPAERFAMDGSAANVGTLVNGQECLLDLVTVHLEGASRDRASFSGNLAVKLDTQRPDSCVCELWLTYQAKLAVAPP